MSYIVQRNHLFYVVAYNGRDPITGTERRRWHPAGTIRSEAEAMRSRIDADAAPRRRKLTLGGFMATTWLDSKMTLTHQTRCRYEWMINHNITPRIGQVRIDVLRPVDLDACYRDLLDNGGRKRQGLSAKTVLEVHRVISNALDLAVDRRIIETNPARKARPPRRVTRSLVPAIWTATQLGEFLQRARTKRLYPALHLVAYTGIRRGELAGLNWGDLDTATSSITIARTRQVTPDGVIQAPVKTRTSRRRIDLDPDTVRVLQRWRCRLTSEGAAITPATPMFVNRRHTAVSPESLSQLFTRSSVELGLPRIRFHDLRHTHASLLVAAGVPIKVVSERLGHAHPGFTMHTYQHLLPGMGAAAANQFAQLIAANR